MSLLRTPVIALLLLTSACSHRKALQLNVTDHPPVFSAPLKSAKHMPASDEPDKAAQFYLERRVASGESDLPLGRYSLARERMARMPVISISQGRSGKQGSQRSMDIGSWSSLGPENQGGRTKSLVIHPQDPKIMYAGAVTGGVWKTIDGGENWRPLTDLFPTTGLGALAMDPVNPDVLYAGTGFWFNSLSGTNVLGSAPRGAGIYRSLDAGESWQPLTNPGGSHFRYINDILVSRLDPQRIYVATWSGIFRSGDGGNTWSHVLNRSAGQNGCQDLVMRSDRPTDYLIAACGTTTAGDAAIFRNAEAESDAQWQKVFQVRSMGNTTLALAPSNQSYIYALISDNGIDNPQWQSSLHAVYRSTVDGDPGTWEARTTNTSPVQANTGILSSNSSFYLNQCVLNAQRSIGGQGWIHNAIAVDPQDPDRLYAGGIDIYRSDDGGLNWGIASFWQAADGPNGAHADLLALVFPPDYDAETRPHLYAATDGGIYLTKNARAAVARGDRAGCQPFQNEVAWQPLHGGYQTTQFYSGAVLPGGATFLGGKQDNGTLRGNLSSPRDWRRLRGGDGAAVAVDPRDPNRMLVSTQNFGLVRSVNGGRTFLNGLSGISEASANFAFIAPLAMDLNNPDRLYAGGRTLWRTANQAQSWSPASSRLPDAWGYVSAVAVSPSDPSKVLFATSQGYILRHPNVLEANESSVWEAARPRPGYTASVTFDPNDANVVYAVYSQFNTAVGQSHIYRSYDGGLNWQGIDGTGDTGIPDIPVFTLAIDPLNRNIFYAGTDIGVFISYDGGTTWSRDSNPFASVPTEALILERESGVTYLYAFTFGRGVWRTRLPDSGVPCVYEMDPIDPITAIGGSLSFSIRTGDSCSWSAISLNPNLDITAPAVGRGTGWVRVDVPLNTSTTPKPIEFKVQDISYKTMQAGAMQVPVAADDFRTPAPIASLPYVGIRDTRSTTKSPTDPKASCALSDPEKTIWWRLTAPETGVLEVLTQAQRYDVAGNSGHVLSVFSSAGEELGCVNSLRNQGALILSRFRFNVIAGNTYVFQASATGGSPLDGGYTILGLRMVQD